MSATSDLRSVSQDSKRDAARKAKWALGATAGPGRNASKPRPYRPSETAYNLARRTSKSAVASLSNTTKIARKLSLQTAAAGGSGAVRADDLAAAEISAWEAAGDGHASSSGESEASPTLDADVGVMYSFDAPQGPSQGSQILNVALAKAVRRYEEKETVRLVNDEYDVLDAEGESVALAGRKAKGARAAAKKVEGPVAVEDGEEDYEFV